MWIRGGNEKVYFSLIFVNDNLCLRQQSAPTSEKPAAPGAASKGL